MFGSAGPDRARHSGARDKCAKRRHVSIACAMRVLRSSSHNHVPTHVSHLPTEFHSSVPIGLARDRENISAKVAVASLKPAQCALRMWASMPSALFYFEVVRRAAQVPGLPCGTA